MHIAIQSNLNEEHGKPDKHLQNEKEILVHFAHINTICKILIKFPLETFIQIRHQHWSNLTVSFFFFFLN